MSERTEYKLQLCNEWEADSAAEQNAVSHGLKALQRTLSHLNRIPLGSIQKENSTLHVALLV